MRRRMHDLVESFVRNSSFGDSSVSDVLKWVKVYVGDERVKISRMSI